MRPRGSWPTGATQRRQINEVERRHGVTVFCPPEERREEARGVHRKTRARQRTGEFRQGMRACMRGSFGRRSQRLRGTTVEPVFGWIKTAIGFRRFHLRGLRKVNLEWDLVCLGYNLRMLGRSLQAAARLRAA